MPAYQAPLGPSPICQKYQLIYDGYCRSLERSVANGEISYEEGFRLSEDKRMQLDKDMANEKQAIINQMAMRKQYVPIPVAVPVSQEDNWDSVVGILGNKKSYSVQSDYSGGYTVRER